MHDQTPLRPDRPADPAISDLETELLAQGRFRFFRTRYHRRRGDGTLAGEVREVFDRGNGAAVIAHDAARHTVLLVRQFRLPAWWAGHEGHLLEVPAGVVEGGDSDPSETVRRELEEETGYRVAAVAPLFALFSSPGAMTERMAFFHASYRAADRVSPGGGVAHEGEDIEIVELVLDEAIARIVRGEIVDQKTVLLLYWLKARC